MRTIHVKRAWGEPVEGRALVMREGFSPRYDLDRLTGIISRIGHSAEGESIRDRVLIIPMTDRGRVCGLVRRSELFAAVAERFIA